MVPHGGQTRRASGREEELINKLIVNYFSQLLIYRASQELETLLFYSGVTKYDCIIPGRYRGPDWMLKPSF